VLERLASNAEHNPVYGLNGKISVLEFISSLLLGKNYTGPYLSNECVCHSCNNRSKNSKERLKRQNKVIINTHFSNVLVK